MTDQHPITPPDKQLVRKWIEDWAGGQMKGPVTEDQLVVATKAAQWGADQELEACCEWVTVQAGPRISSQLRAARRPKLPSLKEQALHELNDVYSRDKIDDSTYDTIRRALEALDD